jgi:hypothetical protein
MTSCGHVLVYEGFKITFIWSSSSFNLLYESATISLLCLCCFTCFAQQTAWPVLKHYEGNTLKKLAMPVGGIGTETSLSRQ